MPSDRDPQIFLSSSEMEWIKTALENGISYRSADDAKKFVKDWYDLRDVVEAKGLLSHASSSHIILSKSLILDEDDSGLVHYGD